MFTRLCLNYVFVKMISTCHVAQGAHRLTTKCKPSVRGAPYRWCLLRLDCAFWVVPLVDEDVVAFSHRRYMTGGCLLNTSAGHLAPPSSFGHMALTTFAGRWRRRREVSTSTSVGTVVETLALPHLWGSLHGAQTKKENKDTAKHRNTKQHIIRNNKRKRSRDKEKIGR